MNANHGAIGPANRKIPAIIASTPVATLSPGLASVSLIVMNVAPKMISVMPIIKSPSHKEATLTVGTPAARLKDKIIIPSFSLRTAGKLMVIHIEDIVCVVPPAAAPANNSIRASMAPIIPTTRLTVPMVFSSILPIPYSPIPIRIRVSSVNRTKMIVKIEKLLIALLNIMFWMPPMNIIYSPNTKKRLCMLTADRYIESMA